MTETLFNTKPKGKSGTEISGYQYQNEYISELQGTSSHTVYNMMRRSDTQVRKILSAISSPIKSAKWSIEQASDSTIDVKVSELMNKIFFEDMDFKHKLGEILTFLPHGYSIFEVIHMNKESKDFGQYTGLANLAFRSQSSITEWKHDPVTGHLEEVHQEQSGDVIVDVWLKANSLLFFFNEQEGDDNGFPLLRPLYGPWKRKTLTETLKMVGIERSAIPTPTLEIPESISVNDEEYKEAVMMLEAFTSAENSFITYPKGWVLDLHQNNGFNPMALEDSIKREDEKMAGAILATFLELGTGGNGGAYALGENLEAFFTMVIASFADVIVQGINTHLIPELVKMNFGDAVETMPKLTVDGISNKVGKEFMETVTGYTGAGVVQIDESLEEYVRRVHNLPKKDENAEIQNNESVDNGDDDPTPPNNDKPSDEPKDDDVKDQDEPVNEGNKQLSEVVQLAEAKKPNSLITQEAAIVEDAMKTNLKFISEKLVADVIRKYKQLPEAQKLKAVDNIKLGGTAKYKRQLKGILTTSANKALDQAKQEVPLEKEVKLSNNEIFFSELDKHGTIKFVDSDFSALPAHVRKLVQLQATRIPERQARELEDRVTFTFMQNEQTTNDYRVIEQELNEATTKYIESNAISTGAVNAASTIVNQTRLEYFMAPEVQEEIYAYRFTNPDPKAEICRTLQNRVFAKDDVEFQQYLPPLHHHCKSYVSVVLRSSLTDAGKGPTIEPLPPLTEKDRKSINFSDRVEHIMRLIDGEGNLEGH